MPDSLAGADLALVVPRRYRGPATSGNGGWTAGAAATLLGAGPGAGLGAGTFAVRVRLSAPPPLGTPMTVTRTPSGGAAHELVAEADGRRVLAAAVLDEEEAVGVLHEVGRVHVEPAVEASERYAGLRGHPFPECFACGTARGPGDGLGLRPGPVGDGLVATPWTPDASVDGGSGAAAGPVVWAALDCPGGWSVDIAGRPMVLGTMTAQVARAPRIGEQCVVTGTALAQEPRKAFTATTLYGQDGDVLARAAHVWIAVDPAGFGASAPAPGPAPAPEGS